MSAGKIWLSKFRAVFDGTWLCLLHNFLHLLKFLIIFGEVTNVIELLVSGWHCFYHWVDLVDYLLFGNLVFMTRLCCWRLRSSASVSFKVVPLTWSVVKVYCNRVIFILWILGDISLSIAFTIWRLMAYGLFVWWIVTVRECTCASSCIPNWQQAFRFQLGDSSFHNQTENVMHKILGTSPGHVSDTGLHWFHGVCSHQLSILLVG